MTVTGVFFAGHDSHERRLNLSLGDAMETALVPVRRSIAPQVSISPFGAMIADLEARASQTGHTHFGRVTWSALPVRHLLADAAALIIDAVGKRSEMRLGTQTDAEHIAEATDARLNVGVLLLYGTPQSAADAFELQVFGAFNRAIKVGYRPGMILTDDAWRALMRGASGMAVQELKSQTPSGEQGDLATFWCRPAYLFLAACVKRGREHTETMRARATQLNHENAVRVSEVHVLSGLSGRTIRWLEGDSSLKDQLGKALQLSAKLDAYEALLAVGIATLKAEQPLRGHEMCVEENGIFLPWLNTAVLKVALGDVNITPGALSPEQAVEAQQRLRELDTSVVTEQVVSVVRSRARRVAPALLVRGLVQVREHLTGQVARLVKSQHAPMLGDHFIDPYLGNIAKVVLTHESAMEYLDPFSNDDVREPLPDELMAAIEAALEWKRFDPEELQMLIEGGSLPHEVIVRHLGDLTASAKKKAVDTLVEYHPELVNVLLSTGHLVWGRGLAERCLPHLSPEYLARALCESLLQETAFEDTLSKYVGIMLLLPEARLREIWADPRYHEALVDFMDAFLFDSGATDISDVQEKALAERVLTSFRTYGLEAYVKFRSAIYGEEPLVPKSERMMPRWEQTASSKRTSWTLVVRMRRVFSKHLAAMIGELSEEECFRRLVHDRPDRDQRVHVFLANRSRFYGP